VTVSTFALEGVAREIRRNKLKKCIAVSPIIDEMQLPRSSKKEVP